MELFILIILLICIIDIWILKNKINKIKNEIDNIINGSTEEIKKEK